VFGVGGGCGGGGRIRETLSVNQSEGLGAYFFLFTKSKRIFGTQRAGLDGPRAGTGDSVGQIHCYLCSSAMKFAGYGVALYSRLLKIIGLFCKRDLKKHDILQKRPMILRSLLIAATPYLYRVSHLLFKISSFPRYGVATISRLLKIKGLFCKRALQRRPIFCKSDLLFKVGSS